MKINKSAFRALVKPENIEKLMFELFDKKFERKITLKDVYDVFRQKNYFMFPEFRDGKIVAMVSMYVMKLFSRKMATIEEVVTLNEFRNQGIGSRLIKLALDKAKELGCVRVELNVREDKPSVQKFYEDLGFVDRKNKALYLWLKK